MLTTKEIKVSCLRKISIILQLLGKNDKALCYVDRIVKEDEANDKDWWRLGSLYVRLSQWDKASEAFLNALNKRNGCAEYIYWLGKVEEEVGHVGVAETLYDQALEQKEDYWEALEAKGKLLINKGCFEEAASYFAKCFQQKPTDNTILNSLGLCSLGIEDLEGACRYFQAALSYNGRDSIIIYNLGTVYIKLKKYFEAKEQFEKIATKEKPEVFSALGFCCSMLNEYDDSLKYYESALKLDPESQEISINMAAVFAQCQRGKEALGLLRNVLIKNPYDSHVLNNIAWIYENLEEYTEAEEYYYRSLALSHGNPDIAYNLICCLRKQSKHMEALEVVEYLLQKPEWQKMAYSSLAELYESLGAEKLAVDFYNKALGLAL